VPALTRAALEVTAAAKLLAIRVGRAAKAKQQAELRREAVEALEGLSLNAMAARLNADSVTTSRGGRSTATAVKRTLALYAGGLERSGRFSKIQSMSNRPTALERAFALAASGKVRSAYEIKQTLKAEGYPEDGQLHGMTISRQLGRIIAAAKAGTEMPS
jgi:hypothetical protein